MLDELWNFYMDRELDELNNAIIAIQNLDLEVDRLNDDLDQLYDFLFDFLQVADSHVELEPLVTRGRKLLRSFADESERHNP